MGEPRNKEKPAAEENPAAREKPTVARQTIEIIQRHQFRFQKKFGQNFLIDDHVLNKIIAGAEIERTDCVLEIGPGIGTLTGRLAEAAGRVIAVEIDRNLIPILEETLADYDNITILNQDAMDLDFAALADTLNGGRPIKVVANLPYYITTPIIMGLLESGTAIHSLTVMVQKEVARRMEAKPGSKDYGALSLAVQYYAMPYLVANVPANCFMPRPDVDSAVIRLTLYEAPPVSVSDARHMFDLIRAGFNFRRKTLVNAVTHSGMAEKEAILAALAACGLSETIRGEALTLEAYAALSDAMTGYDRQ